MRLAPSSGEPVEARFARFAAELRVGEVTPSAAIALERLLLDYVSVVLAGMGDPQCARAAMALGGFSHDAASCAFAQGTCAHWFDWDDTDDPSHVHGGAVIFPVLFAMMCERAALQRSAPGDFVAAAVAGYEIACRIGEALRRNGHRGWMPTGSGATMGAVAAALRLEGADAGRIRSAMGIAASVAGISRQPLADKVNNKGVLAGMAARAAVDALQLDAAGVQGAPRFLEGEYGLGALQGGGAVRWDEALEARAELAIERVSVKPYPCCRSAHGAIDAVMELRDGDAAAASKVDRIRVTAPPGVVERCGTPFRVGDNPRLSAQFSIPYTAAVALRRGGITLEDFTPDRVRRTHAELEGLMQAVEVGRGSITDDVLAPIEVEFIGGGTVLARRRTEILRGDPRAPLTSRQQRDKLESAAGGLLSTAQLERIEHEVRAVRESGPAGLVAVLEDLFAVCAKPR